MPDFDYDLLAALAAVIREGSFDAAASSLNITQSAVSQRVKLLEERLGAIVIVRGRPCTPTELGQELYNHYEQVQLLEHQLRRSLSKNSDRHGNQAATIRIAVNTDSLATWFPSVIHRAYRELFVELDIAADDQEHTNEWLTSGVALAAVTSSDVPIQGFRRTPLGQMEYVAIASPDFVYRYLGDGLDSSSIRKAPSITFNRKDTLPGQWLLNNFGEGVESRGHFVPSFSGYLDCCINGVGWGLMPKGAVRSHLRDGSLVELKRGTCIMTPLHWQTSTQTSDVLKQLAAIVAEEGKKHLAKF